MGLKRHIPNLLTLTNLLVGGLAVTFIFKEKWEYVVFSLGICLILDFLDGFMARLLGVSSELGKQLDSFADLVSFGVVPSLWLYQYLGQTFDKGPNFWGVQLLPLLGLSILLASALRLARFNLSPPTGHFNGLPTPANTLLIVSLILIPRYYPEAALTDLLSQPLAWIIIVGMACFLMLSPFPLLSLKFSHASFSTNWPRYLLLVVSTLGVIFFQFLAIPFLIIFYLLLSVSLNLKG